MVGEGDGLWLRLEAVERISSISGSRCESIFDLEMASLVWVYVVREPEIGVSLVGVGERDGESAELSRADRSARVCDALLGIAPCAEVFSRIRRDLRRFDMKTLGNVK